MWGILGGNKTGEGWNLLNEIESSNNLNETFFKELQVWKNIELTYENKIVQLIHGLKDKGKGKQQDKNYIFSSSLVEILNFIVEQHKNFLSKVNYDINMVNCESAEKLLEASKRLLQQTKTLQRQLNNKKQSIKKVLCQRERLKKFQEQEEMLQILMQDSVDITMDQKIRKKNKIKQLEKQRQEYNIKVKQSADQFKKILERNKQNQTKLQLNNQQQQRCQIETILKLKLQYKTYWKALSSQYDLQFQTPQSLNRLNIATWKQQQALLQRLQEYTHGFTENILRIIGENIIDDMVEYSRDKQVRAKIKRMIESNDVNPEQTDEASRQVRLIKKILNQEVVDKECVELFRNMLNKGTKLRMNFVFILQFFRINNQFQISEAQIYPLHCLIWIFIQSCQVNRDSFALKQLMVLLMTYYVNHTAEQVIHKIYLISFFKKDSVWRDIQYWESILVECIYLEKRNTMRMMAANQYSSTNRKKQLLQAERSALLNQMLIVVRNMVIFELPEKQVKLFASRFIKLLKQDEKFNRDVTNSIDEALKEENKLHEQQQEMIKQFYKCKLTKDNSTEYTIPQSLSKAYTVS